MQKTFTYFEPNPKYSLQECEHYYVNSHVAVVRSIMLPDPSRLSYFVLRARRQYDYSGGWAHPLTLWRYVYCHLLPAVGIAAGSDASAYSEADRQRMARDGMVCLVNNQRNQVTEEILVDRRGLLGPCVKYVFDYVRNAATSRDAARTELSSMLAELKDLLAVAPGARLLAVNWVDTQAESIPGRGQTGRLLDDVPLTAFVEIVFDSSYWAEQFFAQPGMATRLLPRTFAIARGCEVEEVCVFDRRPPCADGER